MIKIHARVEDGASPALRRVIDALEGGKSAELNTVGGRAASEAAKDYHAAFSKAGGWRGRNYLGSRKAGEFGQNVSLGWQFESANGSGATISNNADYYAFKVRGGTIRPKRVSHLTIPMVSEAVGLRARDYEAEHKTRLFRVKGKKALFENDPRRGFRAVYALVKEVTQEPWPEALPDDETLTTAFISGWRGALADMLERGDL
ncbi:MAG: hypothetical protein ACQKBY_06085 [Verrucomicrobiales bacterium]